MAVASKMKLIYIADKRTSRCLNRITSETAAMLLK